MFYSVNSSGLLGLSAYPVRAEVDFSQSMPAFEIVGLPGTAVKESRDRVPLRYSQLRFRLSGG